jgi:hypothetical protein
MALRNGHSNGAGTRRVEPPASGETAPVPPRLVLRRLADALLIDHPRRALVARLDRQAQAAVDRGDLGAAIYLLQRSARALGLTTTLRRRRAI